MSPTPFEQEHNYHHPHPHLQRPMKQETPTIVAATGNNDTCPRMSPSPLKIHRDSHIIKKMPPPSSKSIPSSHVNSPPRATNKSQSNQRGPVIIFTHSPKVIHTNPRDFMALVQKLTGMSSLEGAGPKGHDAKDDHARPYHPEPQLVSVATSSGNSNSNGNNHASNEDNESSSVITDENSCSSNPTSDAVGELQFCTGPLLFDLPPAPPLEASLPPLPLYQPSSSDLLHISGDPSFYDYINSGYLINESTYF